MSIFTQNRVVCPLG